jgi:hypothetical protein
MNSTGQSSSPEMKIDQNNLYHEETFSDLKVGWIRRLTPVRPDGSRDNKRKPLYIGQTQLMTPQGPIPIQCEIPAKTLPDAIAKWPEAMESTMQKVMERAMEMQRQAESRIIKP